MAAPKAPFLDAAGKKSKDVTLTADVFAVEVKPQLIHETVRAEAAAARSGSQSAKSRGLVAGGRSKPWRQKGTGRARAGTTRAPQWTGGGVAFAPQPRSYTLKVNRKAKRSALRGALSDLAGRSALAVIDASGFKEPSTRAAADLVGGWGKELPLVVIAQPEEEAVAKSFRNLDRVLVLEPSELEVGALVWARSVIATEAALDRVKELAS
ncbi:MAG TPA: 50S ribosomal protein L4 [Gaiellaceae bacterium]|jgi:large subunit ribosomal protein L4|nr:50S ribosomal protein L4 [Gaiellaceae bacterium]